jgi:hypothetical protein
MNALLSIDGKRARRMTEEDARTWLAKHGFTATTPMTVRHSVARDGRSETIVTDHYREDGPSDFWSGPRVYKARLTVTYSI